MTVSKKKARRLRRRVNAAFRHYKVRPFRNLQGSPAATKAKHLELALAGDLGVLAWLDAVHGGGRYLTQQLVQQTVFVGAVSFLSGLGQRVLQEMQRRRGE